MSFIIAHWNDAARGALAQENLTSSPARSSSWSPETTRAEGPRGARHCAMSCSRRPPAFATGATASGPTRPRRSRLRRARWCSLPSR